MTHDYSKALEEFNNQYAEVITEDVITCAALVGEQNTQAIQSALRIAKRLQSGEVSEDMASIGIVKATDIEKSKRIRTNIFKAMAAKLLEEESKA